MNQKGAILPTVIMFVALLLLLALGTITIYQGQMRQLMILNQHYEAKSLMLIAKKQLETKRGAVKREVKAMKLEYSTGDVTIKQGQVGEFQFFVKLQNDYILEDVFTLSDLPLKLDTSEMNSEIISP
ncbi:hypothetical protein [Carnobacterium maltaromaticum]|uniref:hypothetical protein n=1 Tax=Carnobacterium maltaromaticum TaxID=2751 RepID=UPI0010719708|nr:hypothetical protein [Carnobacterium maltaromaticum]TFJ73880.1 hypothetical protein CKN94_09495 [Carnobacterium maltaromaticum]TFJ78088.1 hypothetical protein CKN97_09490 [Carnobacterium maltaromaticum]